MSDFEQNMYLLYSKKHQKSLKWNSDPMGDM